MNLFFLECRVYTCGTVSSLSMFTVFLKNVKYADPLQSCCLVFTYENYDVEINCLLKYITYL